MAASLIGCLGQAHFPAFLGRCRSSGSRFVEASGGQAIEEMLTHRSGFKANALNWIRDARQACRNIVNLAWQLAARASPCPYRQQRKAHTTAATSTVYQNIPSSISLVHSYAVILSGARPQNRGSPITHAVGPTQSSIKNAVSGTTGGELPFAALVQNGSKVQDKTQISS